jgi:Fe-S cluster assembly protein SufD
MNARPDTSPDSDGEFAVPYRTAQARLNQQSRFANSDWLQPIREHALEVFTQQGFPTTRDENWKYTSLKKVAERSRELLQDTTDAPDLTAVAKALATVADISDSYRIVFANNEYIENLSRLPASIDGLSIDRLAELDPESRATMLKKLTLAQNSDQRELTTLNTAFLTDGLSIRVAANSDITEPVHIIFVTDGQAVSTQPRLLIDLDTHSRAFVIEHHIGQGAGLTNSVTQIDCAAGATLKYIKLQNDNGRAYHLATQHIDIDHDGHVDAVHIDTGAAMARNDLNISLNGVGSNTNLHGLYLVDGQRHIDNHTRIDHRAKHTQSREQYRGVIAEQGRGVFNGKIIVHRGADGTNAELSNQNLLLSSTAEIDTKPELEIYTDDVKCSHGTTTGQLDENAIFYLRARGIPEESARHMLIHAFAREILSHVDSRAASLIDDTEALVSSHLPDQT